MPPSPSCPKDIFALGAALREAGVPEAELSATLDPVDLMADKHWAYRTARE